jgi:hypothetical protein
MTKRGKHGPGIESHPGRLRGHELVRSQPYATSRSYKGPPGGKFVRANICEIVVGRQFAPQPYRTGGGGIWPFTIYWLGVEAPNERRESS